MKSFNYDSLSHSEMLIKTSTICDLFVSSIVMEMDMVDPNDDL
jgi:hypothetical protein